MDFWRFHVYAFAVFCVDSNITSFIVNHDLKFALFLFAIHICSGWNIGIQKVFLFRYSMSAKIIHKN